MAISLLLEQPTTQHYILKISILLKKRPRMRIKSVVLVKLCLVYKILQLYAADYRVRRGSHNNPSHA